MTDKNLKYSPLVEGKESDGWHKETVKWVIRNEKKVRGIIVSYGREHVKACDVDDIYMSTLEYFHRSEDYDINIAIERGHDNTVTTMEQYISHCVKCCVLRHVASEKYRSKMEMHDIVNDESEYSITENIPSYDNKDDIINLDDVCRLNTSKRYMYGADMYQIMFIRLLCIDRGISDNRMEVILEALGIDKKIIPNRFDTYTEDGPLTEMAKAIVRISINEAIRVLKRYVYAADKIEMAIA